MLIDYFSAVVKFRDKLAAVIIKGAASKQKLRLLFNL